MVEQPLSQILTHVIEHPLEQSLEQSLEHLLDREFYLLALFILLSAFSHLYSR